MGDNEIKVRVNNQWKPTVAPRGGEHTFSGGIYRNVRLVKKSKAHITWYGTRITTPTLESNNGSSSTVKAEVELEGLTQARPLVALIPKLREQFNLAYKSGIDRIWIINVGDLKPKLPKEAQDAFWQLVYYPAVGSAGVAQIYNYATMGDSLAIEALMEKDRRLTEHYNKGIAGGKWNGMMLDNHNGYTKWSIPDNNYNPMTLGFKVEHDLAPKATSEYSIPALPWTW